MSKTGLETIKRITEGIPGSGKVKPILATKDVKFVFSHIGKVAQRIIAQDAEFTFIFADGVIAGDAFSYRPSQEYFGAVSNRTKKFTVQVGTLELDRTYTFLFEGTLPPLCSTSEGNGKNDKKTSTSQQFGTALLYYRRGSEREQLETVVSVQRTNDDWRHKRTDQQSLEIYQVLDATRRNDPKTQLQALRARLAIYEREGADPALVQLVEQAIAKLERGEKLTQEEGRGLRADIGTAVGYDLAKLRDMATVWLQKGYSSERIRWLIHVADNVDTEPDFFSNVDQIEMEVFRLAHQGVDPFTQLDSSSILAFDNVVKKKLALSEFRGLTRKNGHAPPNRAKDVEIKSRLS